MKTSWVCHNEKRAPSGLPSLRKQKKSGKTQSSSADIRKLFRRIEERRDQPSKKTVNVVLNIVNLTLP